MSKPIVAIVGRPNVGKSCLFNRIIGKRLAVVDDTPGVTRDRHYALSSWNDTEFYVTDTGGLLPASKDSLASEIRGQVDLAIDEADAIVFVVDGQTGALEPDVLIARELRKRAADKVILAVNKSESDKPLDHLAGFASLGCGEPSLVSALHGIGASKLLDRIETMVRGHPGHTADRSEDHALGIAVIGRPNAGKSSLVNRLLGKKRMIVNDAPGTTRDAIDSMMQYNGRAIRLIDTAGLRQKSHVKTNLEYYSNLRAIASISRCDVAALVIDAVAGFSEQDAKILEQIARMRKGVLVCLNKWDLVEKDHKTFDHTVADIRAHYHELRFVPILAISALTGQRVTVVPETAAAIYDEMRKRVSPADFRNNLHTWNRLKPHPIVGGSEVRLLGGKQIETHFPLFQIFATNPSLVRPSFIRYLTTMMHEQYGYKGCPVVLTFKPPARPSRRNPSLALRSPA